MSRRAFEKFERGEPLSRKESINAQCYVCNGYSVEMAHDCLGRNCPLYQWSTWGKSHGLRPVSTRGMHLNNKKRGG